MWGKGNRKVAWHYDLAITVKDTQLGRLEQPPEHNAAFTQDSRPPILRLIPISNSMAHSEGKTQLRRSSRHVQNVLTLTSITSQLREIDPNYVQKLPSAADFGFRSIPGRDTCHAVSQEIQIGSKTDIKGTRPVYVSIMDDENSWDVFITGTPRRFAHVDDNLMDLDMPFQLLYDKTVTLSNFRDCLRAFICYIILAKDSSYSLLGFPGYINYLIVVLDMLHSAPLKTMYREGYYTRSVPANPLYDSSDAHDSSNNKEPRSCTRTKRPMMHSMQDLSCRNDNQNSERGALSDASYADSHSQSAVTLLAETQPAVPRNFIANIERRNKENAEDVAAMHSEIIRLRTQVASQSSFSEDHKAEIESLKTTVDSKDIEIQTIKDEVAILEIEAISLRGGLASLNRQKRIVDLAKSKLARRKRYLKARARKAEDAFKKERALRLEVEQKLEEYLDTQRLMVARFS
ncbi:hypothetical protein OPT61_g459 [Boeremia exigua]|uniref:Uncharacterized protein n=1 Tax=Boeremia exigua TaxID=749465 RepID=A0ACC2ITT0_9PLEO|nr:hypothetical protein OPT61_g459 [Boeremia exigua]